MSKTIEQLTAENEKLKAALEDVQKEKKTLEKDVDKTIAITKMGIWKYFFKNEKRIWNKELYEIFGYNPNEPLPSYEDVSSLFRKEDWEKYPSFSQRILEGLFDSFEVDANITLRDHTKKWIWVRFEPMVEEGKIIGIFGTVLDITDRKKKEEELRLAIQKAEESERLKTAFLQNISHEIRTPVNAISGFASLLTSGSQFSNESQTQFLNLIKTSSEKLVDVISDLLAVASIQSQQVSMNPAEVYVNELLDNAYQLFKSSADNTGLEFSVSHGLDQQASHVLTDPYLLEGIIDRLLDNAIKFTAQGKVEFGYHLKDGLLEFYVSDTGIGISEEHFGEIFDRFNQKHDFVNTKYGGTGVGLTISKAYAEMMGGKIWVESAIGKGSTFYFTLPYEPVDSVKEKEHSSDKKKIKTILVAEDEYSNQLLLAEFLKDYGLEILTAQNGKKAIEIVEKNPEIGLVLMDIKMPVLSGDKAAEIIKSKRPDLPIIAQTAYAMKDELDNFSHLFDDYITKPIDITAFEQKISKHLN